MSDATVSEATVEAVALDWLRPLSWTCRHGPDIAPDTPTAERVDHREVVLADRLRSALGRLNPNLPSGALEDALNQLARLVGATLEAGNREMRGKVVAVAGAAVVCYGDEASHSAHRRGDQLGLPVEQSRTKTRGSRERSCWATDGANRVSELAPTRISETSA